MKTFLAFPLSVACAIGVLSTLGCSGPVTNTIHGDVTLDGAPLATGSIQFVPMPGTLGTSTGGNIKDGHYSVTSVKGAPCIGAYRVEIQGMRGTGKMVPDTYKSGKMIEEQAPAVAARFNSESKLQVDLKAGDNVQNFEVSSK